MPRSRRRTLVLPGSTPRKSKRSERGQYKTGNWEYNIATASLIGVAATLAANGWFFRLAANFLVLAMVMMVLFIAIRGFGWKIDRTGDWIIAITGAIVYVFADKYVYTPVFSQYLGQLVPFQITPTNNGFTLVSASPSLFWVATGIFLILVLLLNPFTKSTLPLATKVIALGIGVEAVISLYGLLPTISWIGNPTGTGTVFILPPMTPFLGLGGTFAVFLPSLAYLLLAFGIWYKSGGSFWIYMAVQFVGLGYSIYLAFTMTSAAWLGALFNGLTILYLIALRPQYKHLLSG